MESCHLLVKEIGTTLKSMSQKNNISLVVVEQNASLFSLTDQCIILEKGKIVVEGKKVRNSRFEYYETVLSNLIKNHIYHSLIPHSKSMPC